MTREEPPIVYLDQNHWITLARARVSPENVKKTSGVRELAAADSIWRSLDAGRIRLPLSMAHMVETARAGTKTNRPALAAAMLDGYDGWHMRHPMDVRRCELWWRLLDRPDLAPTVRHIVFSRSPGTPFHSDDYTPFVSDDPDIPDEGRRWVEQQAWRSSWSTVLRSESLTEEDRRATDAVVATWTTSHVDLAEYMRDKPYGSRDVRLVAAGRTMGDLHLEIAKVALIAGMQPDDLLPILNHDHLIEFFAAMPFIGRVMEVTYQRLRNPAQSWVRNDLNDLMYLTCAAAYSDVVVTEKSMAHHLGQAAPMVTPGAVVLRNLDGLRTYLRSF